MRLAAKRWDQLRDADVVVSISIITMVSIPITNRATTSLALVRTEAARVWYTGRYSPKPARAGDRPRKEDSDDVTTIDPAPP